MDQLQYFMGELWEVVAPGLFTIITALIAWVLAEIGRRLPPALRSFYERKLREDLEVAATNAARAALEGDWKHFSFDQGDQKALLTYITSRMQEGAGEAIGYFRPSQTKLDQLALAALGRVTGRPLL